MDPIQNRICVRLSKFGFFDTSHFKAVNLAVLISGGTCLWLFYVPRYQRLKMQILFSLTNLANYLLNITYLYDNKKCNKVILTKHPFVLLLLAPALQNGPVIIKKSKIWARRANSILICLHKDIGLKRSYYWKYGSWGGGLNWSSGYKLLSRK